MKNDMFGTDLFGLPITPRTTGPLAERFTLPPFSVLDARSGAWRERKAMWSAMIGDEGQGRAEDLAYPSTGEFLKILQTRGGTTSVFDPVLAEMAYRWFCPAGGQVVDPFAGGPTRGIVAAALGLEYWGCDLRREQIDANFEAVGRLIVGYTPEWIVGDALEELPMAPPADMIFTCPPYGDLEQYSTDERDLSNMEWHAFRAAYRRIIARSLSTLRADSFAAVVVGDFRDGHGYLRNFVGETILAFEECGARFYNEAILVTPVGSACVRVGRYFNASRKLAKLHQNLLTFCKGDPRIAAKKCKGAPEEYAP